MLKKLRRGDNLQSLLQDNRDKTILVKFFTEWCMPCKSLQANIEKLLTELEQSPEKGNNLLVLEVDAEKFPELAQVSQFNVRTVPALFLFRDGKIVKSERGNMNTEQLKEFLAVA
ncbi:MAG: thioredoxin family protein [Mollicutes bacterium UO1]